MLLAAPPGAYCSAYEIHLTASRQLAWLVLPEPFEPIRCHDRSPLAEIAELREAAAHARCVALRLVPLIEWSWSQPRNHRNIDRVALGDRRQRLTSRSAFDGLGALIIRQLEKV